MSNKMEATFHGDICNLRQHSEQRFCCGGCRRAFSSMVAFDWHRRGQTCTDPAEGGFKAREIAGANGPVTVWGNKAGGYAFWDQPTCPHDSFTGVDQTDLLDPAKVWRCDHCGFKRVGPR